MRLTKIGTRPIIKRTRLKQEDMYKIEFTIFCDKTASGGLGTLSSL